MNLDTCVICRSIASTRCRGCFRPVCDQVCRDACLKFDRQSGWVPKKPRWNPGPRINGRAA